MSRYENNMNVKGGVGTRVTGILNNVTEMT